MNNGGNHLRSFNARSSWIGLALVLVGALPALCSQSYDGSRDQLPTELVERGSGIRFRLISAQTFTMGCSLAPKDCATTDLPAKPATIAAPFYIAETETSVQQFQRFVAATKHRTAAEEIGAGATRVERLGGANITGDRATNTATFKLGGLTPGVYVYEFQKGLTWREPGFEQGLDHPVVFVSSTDGEAFCRWLGGSLPTEMQWEAAARAGGTSQFPRGRELSHEDANYGAKNCCRPAAKGRDQWKFTAPVGSFPPNLYGLFDMVGNVSEWTLDSVRVADPATKEPRADSTLVYRDGSYLDPESGVRLSSRNWADRETPRGDLGFRCVLPASGVLLDGSGGASTGAKPR